MAVIPAPEVPAGDRFALLIGTSEYGDARLGRLSGPAWDVEHLGGVLGDPRLGGFTVTRCVDPTAQEMRTAVETFLLARRHEDLVVVYLSGHGVLDRYNELYFAAADTDRDLLGSTGLEADWLRRRLGRCVARRQVLILDCCHAGAYPGAKSAGELHLDRLAEDARGRLVLHAARGSESAFAAGAEDGTPSGSVYTCVLVEGLRTGAADLDQDGYVSVTELHSYAELRLRELGASQTPQLAVAQAEGQILLTRSPAGRLLEPTALPEEIRQDLDHPRPGRRIGAVIELAAWLEDADPARVLAARLRLDAVADRDVPQVAQVARDQLARYAVPTAADDSAPGASAVAAAAAGPASGAPDAAAGAASESGAEDGAAASMGPDNAAGTDSAGPANQGNQGTKSGNGRPRQPTTRARAALDEAEDIGSRIQNEFLRAQALVGVVTAVAAFDPERAERVAAGIEDGSRRYLALAGLAATVAAFDPDRGERVADTVEDAVWKAHALAGVAATIAASDPDRAERIAADITDKAWKAQALVGVATAVAGSDPERAERLYDRAERVATGVAESGDDEAAWKARALAGVAAALARADFQRARRLFDRARFCAGGITEEAGKAQALSGIATAMAASDPDRAERIAAGIADDSWRARTLAGIGAAVAYVDPERAARWYDQAEHLAEGVGNARRQAEAQIALVRSAAVGDPDRAERIAAGIGNEFWKSQALAGVAPAVAAADPDRAARIAAGINDDTWKVQALIAIAQVWLDQ